MHPILWKYLTQEDLTKLDQMSPEQVEKYIFGFIFQLK